jgi:hypothetical protein
MKNQKGIVYRICLFSSPRIDNIAIGLSPETNESTLKPSCMDFSGIYCFVLFLS